MIPRDHDPDTAVPPLDRQEGTHLVRDLGQLRLLADPTRLRLVHAFAEEPRTTKQVAERLGLPPTRLYHHVSQLEEAGLLRLVATRPVRGTVEKYYQTIARRFAAAPGLLADEGAGAARELALQVLDQARRDVAALTDADLAGRACEPLLARATIVAPPERIRELRERMLGWIAELESDEEPREGDVGEGTGSLAYALTLALLPVEREP